jgi:DNA-binding CsgD family transcriptional regulator
MDKQRNLHLSAMHYSRTISMPERSIAMGTNIHEEPLDPHLLVRLISARDRQDFADELLSAAQQYDAVQEVFAYRLGPSKHPPSVILSSSGLGGAMHRVAMWVADFHAIDPLKTMHLPSVPGQGFTRRVLASEIYNPVYREVCYENPRFIDKLSFCWHDSEQSLVLNFYRGHGSNDHLSGRLQTLANIGLAAVAKRAQQAPQNSENSPQQDLEALHVRLTQRFPQLSTRECQVCARTIAGWSAQTIAQALGISMATVLTYRQRAYARLNFSRASDFLPALLD